MFQRAPSLTESNGKNGMTSGDDPADQALLEKDNGKDIFRDTPIRYLGRFAMHF